MRTTSFRYAQILQGALSALLTQNQNNGRSAWQSVDHVHFHVVTKPENEPTQGLVLTRESWPSYPATDEDCARDADNMKKIGKSHGFPGVSDQNLDKYGV